MDLQQLIDKGNSGDLTAEEQTELLQKLNEDMVKMKEEDPEKYLETLQKLNEVIEELNKDIVSL